MELQVLERVTFSNTTFGPLVHVDKGRVGGSPRTPLLYELLKVEASPGIGELPRTITDRLEQDNIGVIDTRHVGWRRRKMIW